MVLKNSTLILAALGLALASSIAFGQKVVPGHYTKKGKYVPAHVTTPHHKQYKIKQPKLKVAKPRPAKAKAGLTIRSTHDSRFMIGDRVTSIKDEHGVRYPMRNQDDWERYMKSHTGNEAVTIHVSRDGKSHSFKVKNLQAAIGL